MLQKCLKKDFNFNSIISYDFILIFIMFIKYIDSSSLVRYFYPQFLTLDIPSLIPESIASY